MIPRLDELKNIPGVLDGRVKVSEAMAANEEAILELSKVISSSDTLVMNIQLFANDSEKLSSWLSSTTTLETLVDNLKVLNWVFSLNQFVPALTKNDLHIKLLNHSGIKKYIQNNDFAKSRMLSDDLPERIQVRNAIVLANLTRIFENWVDANHTYYTQSNNYKEYLFKSLRGCLAAFNDSTDWYYSLIDDYNSWVNKWIPYSAMLKSDFCKKVDYHQFKLTKKIRNVHKLMKSLFVSPCNDSNAVAILYNKRNAEEEYISQYTSSIINFTTELNVYLNILYGYFAPNSQFLDIKFYPEYYRKLSTEPNPPQIVNANTRKILWGNYRYESSGNITRRKITTNKTFSDKDMFYCLY